MIRHSSVPVASIGWVCLASLTGGLALAAAPVVSNPDKPAEGKSQLALEELWRVDGDNEDVLLGLIAQVGLDREGNAYMLDQQLTEVQVISPAGEYLRTIGREGEGPGEFRRPGDLFVLADGTIGVVQNAPGKIVLLDSAGEPSGEIPVPGSEVGSAFLGNARAAGNELVLVVSQGQPTETGFKAHQRLLRIDRSGKVLATYKEQELVRDFASLTFDEKESFGMRDWGVSAAGDVYMISSFDDYRIEVIGPDGSPKRTIERAYAPRERSQEERDGIRGRIVFRGNRGGHEMEMKVSPTDPAILGVYPRPDGTLWVLSSRGAHDRPDGSLGTFDVFDAEGRFVRQIDLLGEGSFREDSFLFAGDRLFVVLRASDARRAMFGGGSEDEEAEAAEAEPVSVVCYRVPTLRADAVAGD